MTNQIYARQAFAQQGMALPSMHPTPVGEPAGGPGYYGDEQNAAEESGETGSVAQQEQFDDSAESGASPIGEPPGGPNYWGRPSLHIESPAAGAPESVGERPGSPAYFGNGEVAASDHAMPFETSTPADVGEPPGGPDYYGAGASPAKAAHRKTTVVVMNRK